MEEGWSERDGAPRLFHRWRPVDAPRAALVVVHGFGEHGGRYLHVLEALAGAGFASLAVDLRGFGRSGGRRGFIGRFAEYLDDLDLALGLARARAPGLPLVVVGHSMGGLVAALHAIERSPALAGLALSSPALGFAVPTPRRRRLLGRVASVFRPTLTRPSNIDLLRLSHDPHVPVDLMRDEWIVTRVTARWYTENLRAQRRVLARAERIRVPLCLLLAGTDHVADVGVSQSFFERVGSEKKTLRLYPGLYHEVFNETEREDVLGDLARWLSESLSTAGGE